ncbi:hypothetical protein MES5069_460015 [Mesorhizobium escarrei]|uniref:Uncharacterized protein n=1 Tax=Mesorhizobium escarrei TaxID=666018 RepID=A0ABM9E7S3_9HYPH|nr:hypothetical protein MES5069_460015 [Mesorhizobium escarrei]
MSCGQARELLGEGRSWIEGKPDLSFAHHMDHLNAGQDDGMMLVSYCT